MCRWRNTKVPYRFSGMAHELQRSISSGVSRTTVQTYCKTERRRRVAQSVLRIAFSLR
jgi:uncharacterized protein YicC (UPF0701 family)